MLSKKGLVNTVLAIFFVSALFVFNVLPAQAGFSDQAPETDAMSEVKSDQIGAEEEMGGTVKGVVVSVNPVSGSLVIRNTDEDDQTYYLSVKKATTYEGISSISDIHPGDSITVDCYGLEGHLVAENITLQDRAYPEEKPAQLEKVLED
jgi:hypothetical protein